MNGFLRLLVIFAVTLSMVSCSTQQVDDSDSSAEQSLDTSSTLSSSADDFNSEDPMEESQSVAVNVEDSLEKEFNEVEGTPPAEQVQEAASVAQNPAEAAPAPEEELKLDDQPSEVAQTPVVEPPAPEIAPDPVAQEPIVETAEPVDPAPPAQEIAQSTQIKNIKYKANDNGGTVVVEADGPLTYETRMNIENNQFVVDIPNSKLPAKLKRPFNTRDMRGGIGAIDTYQSKGSTTTRIVVQLRNGANEPVVQSEGNSLLIVGSGVSTQTAVADGNDAAPTEQMGDSSEEAKILSSANLEEFMSGNMQFYGKKISLETSDMDIRDAIKFLSEESGVNLVLSEEVKGPISVKLRQVPWDQALVVIMKSKKLGYTRAGNVLRIAPIADLRAEEDEVVKLATAKKALVPLKARIVPVSYAKIDDLVAQIKPFQSDRGKVIGDNRTNSLVISDVQENLERVIKLVQSIDIPPNQVLIEGKVVEATDGFERNIGVNWSASGTDFKAGLAGYRGRDVIGRTGIDITPGLPSSKTFNINFQLGTLDILGDLTAALQLYESKNMAKVLSSPRIVTLHNETAEINQTTQVPLIQETINNGVSTKTAVFKDVKLRLNVTPLITNDGAIIMSVDVNRDFLSGAADVTTGAQAVNSRQAKTKVLVKNGQTAVIGGIYQSDQTLGENKVPWLGDIPILGWLFKNQSKQDNRNELLIFLTPRILGQADSTSIPSEMSKEF